MSLIFAGGELADFDSASTVYGQTTSNVDPNYARVGLQLYTSAHFIQKTLLTGQTTFWAAFRYNAGNAGTVAGRPLAVLTSSAGNVMRIVGTGTTSTFNLEVWDGAAWQVVGSPISFFVGAARFAIQTVIGVSGAVRVYKDEVLVSEYTGDTSSLGAVDKLQIRSHYDIFNVVSEVIIANHDIRAARLKTLAVTGDGANTGWSGAYTDVDAYNETDSSFIASDTAGEKRTFILGDLPTDSLVVDAVLLSARCRRNATGPSGINALARTGGVDYAQSLDALIENFENRQSIWAVNPATAAPWAKADVDALELGVESVA